MYALDEDEDIDELLPAAITLSDRLAIVVHVQRLRYAGVLAGLTGSSLAVAAFGFLTFGRYDHAFRFSEEVHQTSPLLLIASVYALSLSCMAYYRSSVDRFQIEVTRRRLAAAIMEAAELDSSR